MNRFAGLSVLAVALATAGPLAAQDMGSVDAKVEQAPVAVDKPATDTAEPSSVNNAATITVTKQPGDTHVRIVRLSQIQGKVGLDRGTGHGGRAFDAEHADY